VLQKRPSDNTLCRDTCTYGKYRDDVERDWYLWIAAPCVTNITTHCRFDDVPFYPNSKSTKGKDAKTDSPPQRHA
ncbi:Protein C10F3.7, partial [Aphelenchoides avenae]